MKTPYKFDAVRRSLYLEYIRRGYRLSAAAEAVGVSRATVWVYCKQNPDFQKQVDIAELPATDALEDKLYQLALNGNLNAIRLWLYNRNPERWSEREKPKQAVEDVAPATLKELEEELLAKIKDLPADTP